MSEHNAADRSFVSGLVTYLPMIIQISSVAAAILASWTLLGRDISDLDEATKALNARAGAMEVRLYTIEREQATSEIKYENLRDAVNELRRQSGLRMTPSEVPR